MRRGQLTLGCRRSCAGGHGGSQGFQSKGKVLISLLNHSSASKLHFQLHFQPVGEDFGIITSGGPVTPEAGCCRMCWASGTHREHWDGGKAGGDKDMFPLGHMWPQAWPREDLLWR